MLIAKTVKLVSPILAVQQQGRSEQGGQNRREFKKRVVAGDPEGEIHIQTDMQRWQWAFLEARDALNLESVAVASIIPSSIYKVRRTSTYFRNYSRGFAGSKETEGFESIPSGQVLIWKFTLSKSLPPFAEEDGRFLRPPDIAEFDKMLSHIGEYLGMSEWGHAYAYGRFVIKEDANAPTPKT